MVDPWYGSLHCAGRSVSSLNLPPCVLQLWKFSRVWFGFCVVVVVVTANFLTLITSVLSFWNSCSLHK